jgi:GNAT superfamily N-acetyltransferase
MDAARFSFQPATAERLADVTAVFGDCSYGRKCWCAYWYLPNRDYKAGWGEGNRAHFEGLVLTGKEPGIIAYAGDEPAGWLGIAPRTAFDKLNRSKPLAPIDDRQVWAMNCFIVRKPWRRSGLMRQLIRAGLEFVCERGGRVVEAYPFDGNRKPLGDELFIGTAAAFRDCGFTEVARRLPSRPVMRLTLE